MLRQTEPSKSEELLKEANYFKNNHKRMQYMETREDGFPIGSGMVESAAKQFKARFAGAGMRWSRAGLIRLLPVRTAILRKRFVRCGLEFTTRPKTDLHPIQRLLLKCPSGYAKLNIEVCLP